MIAEKTSWSDDYIMWGISWVNLRMMLADAPGMSKKKKTTEVTGDELAKILGI
ncbi:hypothetical protein [Pedobacter suwonensis]|uniref:hypothetical protein n=1 Tax=Pedobacter suwonensis TaxID=332999 RepID=UPI0016485798|nr:hypothetical protein [Pedobacter suwonensis]